MTRSLGFYWIGIALLICAACDGSRPGPIAAPGPSAVDRLELTGPTTVAPGEVVQFRLLAISATGSRRDVTAQAEWDSSNADVLTLGSAGQAAAKNPGQATVRVVFETRTITATAIVVPPGTYGVTGTVAQLFSGAAIAGARVQALSGSPIVETRAIQAAGSGCTASLPPPNCT